MQIKIKISFYFYEITKYEIFFFFVLAKQNKNFSANINLPSQRFQITCEHKCAIFYHFYKFQREFICNIYCIDFLQKTNSPLKPASQ